MACAERCLAAARDVRDVRERQRNRAADEQLRAREPAEAAQLAHDGEHAAQEEQQTQAESEQEVHPGLRGGDPRAR